MVLDEDKNFHYAMGSARAGSILFIEEKMVVWKPRETLGDTELAKYLVTSG